MIDSYKKNKHKIYQSWCILTTDISKHTIFAHDNFIIVIIIPHILTYYKYATCFVLAVLIQCKKKYK